MIRKILKVLTKGKSITRWFDCSVGFVGLHVSPNQFREFQFLLLVMGLWVKIDFRRMSNGVDLGPKSLKLQATLQGLTTVNMFDYRRVMRCRNDPVTPYNERLAVLGAEKSSSHLHTIWNLVGEETRLTYIRGFNSIASSSPATPCLSLPHDTRWYEITLYLSNETVILLL
jgi:hypothetical protein